MKYVRDFHQFNQQVMEGNYVDTVDLFKKTQGFVEESTTLVKYLEEQLEQMTEVADDLRHEHEKTGNPDYLVISEKIHSLLDPLKTAIKDHYDPFTRNNNFSQLLDTVRKHYRPNPMGL